MPWKTLCGFPPVNDDVSLLVPNGRWRPDTVITDVDGNEIFVVVEQTNEMRSYEVVFGDLDGRRLVCVKRHLMKAFWRDGFYFCTYRPNYPGQKALTDRDIDNKKVYPFSYLEVQPLKGIFLYRYFDSHEQLKPPRLTSQNPWFGFMTVCCTPLMRFGNFSARFHKTKSPQTVITVDQWSNVVKVGPGNDLLAALCIAYVFDKVQGQPLITVVGRDEDEELEDVGSIESEDDMNDRELEMENMPGSKNRGYRDEEEQQHYLGDDPQRQKLNPDDDPARREQQQEDGYNYDDNGAADDGYYEGENQNGNYHYDDPNNGGAVDDDGYLGEQYQQQDGANDYGEDGYLGTKQQQQQQQHDGDTYDYPQGERGANGGYDNNYHPQGGTDDYLAGEEEEPIVDPYQGQAHHHRTANNDRPEIV